MNNDLEQFSEESLKELIEHVNQMPDANGKAQFAALARIALSAKQAKPVAWITWHQGCRAPDDCEDYLNAYTYKTEEKSVDGSDAFPVYTTPQPAHTEVNSPVIPDGWVIAPKHVTSAMAEAGKLLDKRLNLWKCQDIYQAMLRAAPKPESE